MELVHFDALPLRTPSDVAGVKRFAPDDRFPMPEKGGDGGLRGSGILRYNTR